MLPSEYMQNAKLKKWHESKRLEEMGKELDAEEFLRRRTLSRKTGSTLGAAQSSGGATTGMTSVVEQSGISGVQSLVQSAALGPMSRAGSMAAERTESILVRRLESLASVYRATSFSSRRLALKAGSVARLRPDTRTWLHIDAYGQQLPDDSAAVGLQGASTWRYWSTAVYNLMAEPGSSRWASVVSYFMFVVIVTSTVTFVLDTLPGLSDGVHDAFSLVETIVVQIFTADYLIRLVTCPFNRLRFAMLPLSIVDVASVVPWYVGQILDNDNVNATSVFRVLRLMRVFRAFKLTGRYNKLNLVVATLQQSMDVLGLVLLFMLMLIIFFSTLLFFTERGELDDTLGYYVRNREVKMDLDASGNPQPAPSPFDSIPAGFWWSIVTLMTVGYGDVVPVSAGGKVVACVAMVMGVLSLALPISVLGTNFTNAWLDAREAAKRRSTRASPAVAALEECLVTHATNTEDLVKLYMLVEQQLDELRGKLHDKVKARKQEVMGNDELVFSSALGSGALGSAGMDPESAGFFAPDAHLQDAPIQEEGEEERGGGTWETGSPHATSSVYDPVSGYTTANGSRAVACEHAAVLAAAPDASYIGASGGGGHGGPGGSEGTGSGVSLTRGRSRRASILELHAMMADEIAVARASSRAVSCSGAPGGLRPVPSGTSPELELLAAGLHAELGMLQGSQQNTEEVLEAAERVLSSVSAARMGSAPSVRWGGDQVLGGEPQVPRLRPGSRTPSTTHASVTMAQSSASGGSASPFAAGRAYGPGAQGQPVAEAHAPTGTSHSAAAVHMAVAPMMPAGGRGGWRGQGAACQDSQPQMLTPQRGPGSPLSSGPLAEGWHDTATAAGGVDGSDASVQGRQAEATTGRSWNRVGGGSRLPVFDFDFLFQGKPSSATHEDEVLEALRACDSGVSQGKAIPWWQGREGWPMHSPTGGRPLGEGLSFDSRLYPQKQHADCGLNPSSKLGMGDGAGVEAFNTGDEGLKGDTAASGKQAQLMNKIAAFMGHQFSTRYQKDVDEMVELEQSMQQKIDFLHKLLEVTGLLRSAQFPEFVKELRFKYRQFEFIHQETVDLRLALSEVEGDVGEVEAAMQDLEERFQYSVPTPDAQVQLIARVRGGTLPSQPFACSASRSGVGGAGGVGGDTWPTPPAGGGSTGDKSGCGSGSGRVQAGGDGEGPATVCNLHGSGGAGLLPSAVPGVEVVATAQAGAPQRTSQGGGQVMSGMGSKRRSGDGSADKPRGLSRGAAEIAGGFMTTLLRKLGHVAGGRVHPTSNPTSTTPGSMPGMGVGPGVEERTSNGGGPIGSNSVVRRSTVKREGMALIDLADVLAQQDKATAAAALAAVADASVRAPLLRHTSTQGSRRMAASPSATGALGMSPATWGRILAVAAPSSHRASRAVSDDATLLATTTAFGSRVSREDSAGPGNYARMTTGSGSGCGVPLMAVGTNSLHERGSKGSQQGRSSVTQGSTQPVLLQHGSGGAGGVRHTAQAQELPNPQGMQLSGPAAATTDGECGSGGVERTSIRPRLAPLAAAVLAETINRGRLQPLDGPSHKSHLGHQD